MPSFRYFGNIEVGSQPSLEDLRKLYDAVVLCTGASGERLLGIAGEESFGVVGAPAFVTHYEVVHSSLEQISVYSFDLLLLNSRAREKYLFDVF